MTDLEMNRLCAEAMGYVVEAGAPEISVRKKFDTLASCYDPLHDDAQAMALVKKFHLESYWNGSVWGVSDGLGRSAHVLRGDLNRAIVECVAKMQAAHAALANDR